MEEEKRTILSQKTLMPVSAIIIVIGMFASGAIWVGVVSNRISQIEMNMEGMEREVNEVKQNYYTANDRMARIETKLDIVIDKLKK